MNPLCPHCGKILDSEREQFIKCCWVCRRYALLRGQWPIQSEVKDMVIELTDDQIVRVFQLCSKIAAVKHTVPAPPQGMDGDIELAKNLRATLERENESLIELGALLR